MSREARFSKLIHWLPVLLWSVSFIIFFPLGWLISDEFTYIMQSKALLSGQKYLEVIDPVSGALTAVKNSHYTHGNAVWISIWSLLTGGKGIFIGSLFAAVGAYILSRRTLRSQGYGPIPALLILLYPGTLIFSNSVMSGMPSLLIVATFLYVLLSRAESGKKWLLLTMIAVLSAWLRETNVLLLGGICLIHFIQDRRWLGYYVAGTLLGTLPRLISSWYFYDDPIYYVLGERFAWSHMIDNALVYGPLLIFAMPLAIPVLWMYRGKYRGPIVISVSAFLIVYLLYGYNATHYSGNVRGTLIMSRFLLPIVPIYALAVGSILARNRYTIGRAANYLVYSFAAFLLAIGQYMYHQATSQHGALAIQLHDRYSDRPILMDLSGDTPILRYVNTYYGNYTNLIDIYRISDPDYLNQLITTLGPILVMYTSSTASQEKSQLSAEVTALIEEIPHGYQLDPVDDIVIDDGLRIHILELTSISQ